MVLYNNVKLILDIFVKLILDIFWNLYIYILVYFIFMIISKLLSSLLKLYFLM